MALISIVVPVYYNAGSLPELAERLGAVAGEMRAHTFEFIYVDDGSGDDSYEVMQGLAMADRRVKLVKLVRNFGSHAAITAGLSHAQGDVVGFVAADLQDPPELLTEMVDRCLSGYPVVYAVRSTRFGDPLPTRIMAKVSNWLISKIVVGETIPNGIGFFVAERRVIDQLLQVSERSMNLLWLLVWMGFKSSSVPYDRIARKHGQSKWTLLKKILYFIDTITSFTILPLRVASGMGVLISGTGFLYALIVVILRLTNEIDVSGWSALMIALLFTAGTTLMILGVLGEYLWRLMESTRRRPMFIVEEVYQGEPVA